jgi:hypothetical protein
MSKCVKELYMGQDDSNTLKDENLQKSISVRWNSNIEHDVHVIGEKSKGYKIMHICEARKVTSRYTLLMYSGIILGPLAGLISAIGSITNPDAPITIPLVSSCISFISGIVVAIIKYGKFEEKSSHHKIAASKYTSLESNVRRQLVLNWKDRVSASYYLEYVGSNFDELFLNSPLIDKKTYDDYTKIANKYGIIVPDEYGLTIKICDTYKLDKLDEIKNVSKINISDDDTLLIESTKNYNKQKIQDNTNTETTDTLIVEKIIKRGETTSQLSELNKYSDGRMEYEMNRMMGLILK